MPKREDPHHPDKDVAYDAGYSFGRGLGRDSEHPADADDAEEIARLRQAIEDAFEEARNLDTADVSIGISGKEVTLTGSVPTDDQRQQVIALVERQSGVGKVTSALTVAGS
jgi:osmotically-inducible protein OsmY